MERKHYFLVKKSYKKANKNKQNGTIMKVGISSKSNLNKKSRNHSSKKVPPKAIT